MMNNLFRKFVMISIFSLLFLTGFVAISKNMVSASTGAITMTNCYPSGAETYQIIDHFTEQFLAVNTNTTVSVSLDGGTPIPMIYKGLLNEVAAGDTVTRDWYTWETTISPLATPGRHSFQFLGKYYVWQETDQYWAEFNFSSNVRSFIIESPTMSKTNNNSSTFTSKELNLSTPEGLALKIPEAHDQQLRIKK